MISPGIKIDDRELQTVLAKIVQRGTNKGNGLRTIGAIARESIRYNFRSGGRPNKWQASKRADGKRGQTLRKSGRLMNSISSTVADDRVIVGTNVIYAATHNYGAKKASFGTVVARIPAHSRKNTSANIKSGRKKTASGVSFVRAHTRKMSVPWGDIPARPFMLLQQEDILSIESAIANHMIGGVNAKF
jgi:phage virion morphogenesis protein